MHAVLVTFCLVLAATQYFFGSAHMILEEKLSTNQIAASQALSQVLETVSPPVVIVELPKSAKKIRRTKKQKKSSSAVRRPPPAGCVPLLGSCKSADSVCCDFCAFCQCRLFRTVCYCRMGNPRC